MDGKKERAALRELIVTAIFAALLCITAPLSIPAGIAPISLATFTIYVASAVLGRKRAPAAVLVYIILGALGVPVFAGFRGGFQVIAGVTGGYIVGYIPCAFVAGLFAERFGGKKLWCALGMALGTLCCYAFGTAWYSISARVPFGAALMGCVLPYLPGDAIKIAAATVLSALLRPVVEKFRGSANR